MNSQNHPAIGDFQPDDPALDNRVVILNGFTDPEISEIMRSVKNLCRSAEYPGGQGIDAERRDLIFAKATPTSLQSSLGSLIVDMSGDHEYLKNHPPKPRGLPA